MDLGENILNPFSEFARRGILKSLLDRTFSWQQGIKYPRSDETQKQLEIYSVSFSETLSKTG